MKKKLDQKEMISIGLFFVGIILILISYFFVIKPYNQNLVSTQSRIGKSQINIGRVPLMPPSLWR